MCHLGHLIPHARLQSVIGLSLYNLLLLIILLGYKVLISRNFMLASFLSSEVQEVGVGF